MDQKQTPVFDGLLEYHNAQQYSFHVPGHKDGLIFPDKAGQWFRKLLAIDATEVAGLDELYHPDGILRSGEALLRDYYGTLASYFLVNGSTAGNLTMVMAACRRGDTVFVARDSHKSVFNAVQLSGASPVFLAPQVDEASGLAFGVSDEAWVQAIHRYPKPKALILTYPNYYGMAAVHLRRLIDRAHDCGAAVLVDEAHGPHFRLGTPVPPSSLDLGADLVVQSAHKMLPAMTMGAYLHVNSSLIPKQKVAAVREMLQTSSPSYPIMASLDLARYYLANTDRQTFQCWIRRRDQFVDALGSMKNAGVLTADPDRFLIDPFKITLELKPGLNGFDVQKALLQSGVYPEMADPCHILLTLGLTDRMNLIPAAEKIREVVDSVSARSGYRRKTAGSFPLCSTLAGSIDVLAGKRKDLVTLDQAAGGIAAEPVIPYPPGVPVILKGERVAAGQINAVRTWMDAGASFQNENIMSGKLTIYRSGV
ncbi:aminotransferase class I/II-fold pyridoxal phosphate-dependent enzyme [Sporolactobacillus vineae]|uniref:aminotransferase class I/II-fold pyridoxal phosphate-dependent enzyme n=1 Tax=Sporolactobacillus vineae TaxID=444463 RepID=UPI000287EB97|nr:aminotransferase class I/II-fold pyridoxal phosphate-dependent enzyme [Sporolactobacillus vineae]